MTTQYKLLAADSISPSIFRAYDIRGIVGDSFTTDSVYTIGRAIGFIAKQRNLNSILTARDGRLSGPSLGAALQAGLIDSGIKVVDLGMLPSPVLYYATHKLGITSGVMLTGSHNPPDYNGLKIILDGTALAADEIYSIYTGIQKQEFGQGQGSIQYQDVLPEYLKEITQTIHLKRPLKIVIDCGSGITGKTAPLLFKELGCEVIELYCEVDGNFPHHHPDPSQLDNLQDLIRTVKEEKADIGLAFDGDGDRLGIITNQGEVIWPDRQMMLYAKDILMNNPGAAIIFDVKCTSLLPKVIQHYGGKPLMWKTGHSLVKAKLRETGAALAGEMSGHIFFKERWYGFDDGVYAGARLLEILAKEPRSSSEIFCEFPDSIHTPELKITLPEEQKFIFIEKFIQQSDFDNGQITTIDGLRVDFPDGWGLLRASNTTPCLILRFEAENTQALLRIQTLFREKLLAVQEDILLPF